MDKVIRGPLINFGRGKGFMSRALMASVGFAFLSMLTLSLAVFKDQPEHVSNVEALKESIYVAIGLMVGSVVLYTFSVTDYYYYMLTPTTLRVKNLLFPYMREFDYSRIVKISFHKGINGESITIVFKEDYYENSKAYTSQNISIEQWQRFRQELNTFNIVCEDSSGGFFDNYQGII